MKCIYDFENNGIYIVIEYLNKLKKNINFDEIDKLILTINNNHLFIINNINNLVINDFDFKTHLNVMIKYINLFDSINLNFSNEEYVKIFKLIENDYLLYLQNLNLNKTN